MSEKGEAMYPDKLVQGAGEAARGEMGLRGRAFRDVSGQDGSLSRKEGASVTGICRSVDGTLRCRSNTLNEALCP